MNKNVLIIGGLGIAAVAAILIFSKKKESGEETTLAKSKEEPTTTQEQADVEEAEKLQEEAENLPDTPEGRNRAKQIADRLAKIARRSPVGMIVRAQVAVAKKVGGIARQAGKNVSRAIDKLEEKGKIRRQCRKEADDKFGFPIRPKKIKEKVEFRKQCKREGGNDDFTSFSSDLLSNEGEIFAFNGHTF